MLELLLAISISAVVAAVLYASLAVAFRARDAALAVQSPSQRGRAALAVIAGDLMGVQPPTGLLAGGFVGQDESTIDGRPADAVRFHTNSMMWPPDEPMGEIVRVELLLAPDSVAVTHAASHHSLVRDVTVNLLASSEPRVFRQTLVDQVLSFNITYFDGSAWHDAWDAAQQDDALPPIVAIELVMLADTRREVDADNPPTVTIRRSVTMLAGRTRDQRNQEAQGG